MRSEIKGVAFDLDGTLYPNHRFFVKLLPFVLKHWSLLSAFGKARTIMRQQQENNELIQGDFYKAQAEITAEILGVPPEQLQEKIDTLIYKGWEPMFKKVKLFRNTEKTLIALKNAGYKLGLLSDFPPKAKLEYLGLGGIWDAVLCSEHCGALKPHPKSLTELAAAMSLPPQNILYVGNSHKYDVVGASRAGMKTALIKSSVFVNLCGKKPKPDFSFYNYRQLYDFMLS